MFERGGSLSLSSISWWGIRFGESWEFSLSLSLPPSRTDGPTARCLPVGVRQSVCTCACACGHRGQVGFSEGNVVVVVVGSTGLRASTTSLTCRWRRPTPAPGGIPGTTYGSDRARCEPRRQQVASSLAACNPRPTHPPTSRHTRSHGPWTTTRQLWTDGRICRTDKEPHAYLWRGPLPPHFTPDRVRAGARYGDRGVYTPWRWRLGRAWVNGRMGECANG